MISSVLIAAYFNFFHTGIEDWEKIVIGAILTTIVWVIATYITPPDDERTLRNFIKIVNPGGPGWKKFQVLDSNESWAVPNGIVAMILGCIAVYGFLLGVGQLIYGQTVSGFALLVVSCFAALRLKIRYKL
jgi:hypothetical protein